MQPRIESIHVGRPRCFDAEGKSGKPWQSAICKTQVTGSVKLGLANLDGDEQADLVHHGGRDKAVLAYPISHYLAWNNEIANIGFAAGSFGENLTVSGIDESTCCIGDVFQVGDCLLQVSQPRQPCWKLSRRWGIPKLAHLVQSNGRTGWYLRVLNTGSIESSMELVLVERRHPHLTVSWASSVMYAKPRRPDDDLRLADCPELSESWRTNLIARSLGREAKSDPKRLD